MSSPSDQVATDAAAEIPTSETPIVEAKDEGHDLAEQLSEVYTRFATFGDRSVAASSGRGVPAGPQMDGPRFARFAKDTKIIGKTVTRTDVDIIFNKCKAKTARKLIYSEFCQALHQLAEIRYPKEEPEARYQHLVRDTVRNGKPNVNNASTPIRSPSGSVFDRLTDHSTYTATHKQRYNADGTGRGKAGRHDDQHGLISWDELMRK